MVKKPVKEFDVMAKITMTVTASVSANSLTEAINESQTMSEKDFVTFNGDYLDGKFQIVGVYEVD